jgi:hypothetical protein
MARRTAEGIVHIGKWLTEVNEKLTKQKQWRSWLKGEFGWSHMTAHRFMSVYKKVGCNNLLHLEIDASALYLIAAPSTPEPVRREVLERAKSEPMTHAEAKRLLYEYQGRMELPTPCVWKAQ